VLYHYSRIYQINALTSALQKVPATIVDPESMPVSDTELRRPEVKLAVANALSNGAHLTQAEASFNELIENQGFAPVGRAARFNLANSYLKEGLKSPDDPAQSGPMLELAKQRYRDLLREVPDHWGARYNLERALRLAPELSTAADTNQNDPIKRVRVIVPGFEKQDLP
jgi:mxaK protein